MCVTERYAVVYQIICRIGGVGKSVFCAVFHYIIPELHCGNHTLKQSQTSLYGIDGVKGQFFIFLHVFIICQRDSLHGCQNGHQCAIDTTGLSSYQLGDIRVFLLRHDAASGAVGIINLHKLILVGVPDDDFLGKTAQMHHDRGHGR